MNQMKMCAIGVLCLGALGATSLSAYASEQFAEEMIRSSITIMDGNGSNVENLEMENVQYLEKVVLDEETLDSRVESFPMEGTSAQLNDHGDVQYMEKVELTK